jgi:hypothetical protein
MLLDYNRKECSHDGVMMFLPVLYTKQSVETIDCLTCLTCSTECSPRSRCCLGSSCVFLALLNLIQFQLRSVSRWGADSNIEVCWGGGVRMYQASSWRPMVVGWRTYFSRLSISMMSSFLLGPTKSWQPRWCHCGCLTINTIGVDIKLKGRLRGPTIFKEIWQKTKMKEKFWYD